MGFLLQAGRFVGLSLLILTVACAGRGPGDSLPRLDPLAGAARHPLTPNAAPLEEALEALLLEPEDLRLPEGLLREGRSNRFMLGSFAAAARDPLGIPYRLAHLERALLDKAGELHETLLTAGAQTDARVFRGAFGDPLAGIDAAIEKSENPLLMALLELEQEERGKPDAAWLRAVASASETVPEDVAAEAARILLASQVAAECQRRALEGAGEMLGENFESELLAALLEREAEAPEEMEAALAALDLDYLLAGALDIALAIDRAVEALGDRVTTESFSFEADTGLGRVVLRAGAAGAAELPAGGGPWLLVMDLDGDDVWRGGGANAGIGHPVSVLMDFGGNDRYLANETETSWGSGLLGYGFLYDGGGDDRYEGAALSQGSGCLGVGVLWDAAGDDAYELVAHGQGAALGGVGLLHDAAGHDTYRAFTMAQGFGSTRCFGLLLERGEGDDHYLLRNDELRYPSAQARQTHNSSLGQGFGQGWRRDLTDGHSMAGGTGVLLDAGGDDHYEAAVFGQGSAYWFAEGYLIDIGGDDLYEAHYYCQGANAHFAVSALVDRAGDDRYRATANMSQGAAHDFGVAWLVDESGNDTHEGGVLSLGVGNANGLGFFLDVAGADRYVLRPDGRDRALGMARMIKPGSSRESRLNLGLFLDMGGDDVYEGAPGGAGNGRRWLGPLLYPQWQLPAERGMGVDADQEGRSPLRLRPYTELEE